MIVIVVAEASFQQQHDANTGVPRLTANEAHRPPD
ncbi:hypothetical protein ACVWWN_000683 [Mycobacterium sp. URHB0021]